MYIAIIFLLFLQKLVTLRNLRYQVFELSDANSGVSISQLLQNELKLAYDDRALIQFQGYVSAKRSFGSSLSFIDLVGYPELDICQALLRKELYKGQNYQGYQKCALPGARFLLQGKAAPTKNPGEAVLLIQNMRLLEVPRQPQYIKAILSLVANGDLPMGEVADAAFLSNDTLQKTMIHQPENDATHSAFAKSIFRAMPPLPTDLEEMISKKLTCSPQRLERPPEEAFTLMPSMEGNISVQQACQTSMPVAITTVGFIQNRRRYDDKVTVVNLVDDLVPSPNDHDEFDAVKRTRLECTLHPDLLGQADTYGQLLAFGSRVSLTGILVKSSRSGQSSTLWVKEARLVRAPSRPTTLRYLLDALCDGLITVDEAAGALLISVAEATELSSLEDLTARQWHANMLAVKLQTNEFRPTHAMQDSLSVLDKYRDHRIRRPLEAPRTIEVDPCNSLARGLPGSRWQSKKRPQLEWMVQEIADVVKSHGDFGKRILHILDVGGGKGKLANYLAQFLGDSVQVHVIDIAKGAVHNGAMRAKRLNLSVQYNVADASQAQFHDMKIDVVVALHACGHLSDVALAHAIQHEAGFVICPCCFMSNTSLRIPGTGETVENFLKIPLSNWLALKYVAEIQGDVELSSEAVHTICAIRADAVSRQLPNCAIDLKTFPIQYSTRNVCLVGRVSDYRIK